MMGEPMEIPQFDLAEQIMAEQRKVAATRRKGPARKSNAVEPESPKSELGCPKSVFCLPPSEIGLPACQAEQIIAEIVARDIRRLCGDDASVAR